MIKTIILGILLVPMAVLAETYTVSSIDINSITCPAGETATDVFFSEKAPLKVENRKNKVFFEFEAIKEEYQAAYDQTGVRILYAEDPVTVTLFCNDNEHLLTLIPKQLKSGVSISLQKKQNDELKNAFDGMKREEQLSEIITQLFTDNLLKGFRKTPAESVDSVNGVSTYLRNQYIGGGYIVKEIYLYAPAKVILSEDDLLQLNFIKYPVAASLLDTEFIGWSRAVIVEVEK